MEINFFIELSNFWVDFNGLNNRNSQRSHYAPKVFKKSKGNDDQMGENRKQQGSKQLEIRENLENKAKGLHQMFGNLH